MPKWMGWVPNRRVYKTLNTVELSKAAMLSNVHLIHQLHPSFSIIPVLKSNAYGHGLREVAAILNDATCDLVAVDGYFEAACIRHISNHQILVLGYIDAANVRLLDTRRCSFVVQDVKMLAALGGLRRKVRVHLELNTGMNRLGLSVDELTSYLATFKRFPNLELEGIMSHLADADNSRDDALTRQQVLHFDKMVADILKHGFKPGYIHIAQTAGSAKVKSTYANALRLGIGLYGVSPLDAPDAKSRIFDDLQPVLTLKSTIIKVIELRPGDGVGYNATFIVRQPMRIGVLPLGYYEGLPRELSNRAVVTAGMHELPIVGRVSMNHAMVDLKDSALGVGDAVTVISANIVQPNSIARISSQYGIFPYSLLTGISSSVRRLII